MAKTTKRTTKKTTKAKAAVKKTNTKAKKANAKKAKSKEVTVDRRRKDRRGKTDEPVAEKVLVKETSPAAPERREKVQRRRQIDPTTCERDYTDHEIEFMHALDAYKRSSGRMFPTCSEILEVVRDLGYERKLADDESQQEASSENAGQAAETANQPGNVSESSLDDQLKDLETESLFS